MRTPLVPCTSDWSFHHLCTHNPHQYPQFFRSSQFASSCLIPYVDPHVYFYRLNIVLFYIRVELSAWYSVSSGILAGHSLLFVLRNLLLHFIGCVLRTELDIVVVIWVRVPVVKGHVIAQSLNWWHLLSCSRRVAWTCRISARRERIVLHFLLAWETMMHLWILRIRLFVACGQFYSYKKGNTWRNRLKTGDFIFVDLAEFAWTSFFILIIRWLWTWVSPAIFWLRLFWDDLILVLAGGNGLNGRWRHRNTRRNVTVTAETRFWLRYIHFCLIRVFSQSIKIRMSKGFFGYKYLSP